MFVPGIFKNKIIQHELRKPLQSLTPTFVPHTCLPCGPLHAGISEETHKEWSLKLKQRALNITHWLYITKKTFLILLRQKFTLMATKDYQVSQCCQLVVEWYKNPDCIIINKQHGTKLRRTDWGEVYWSMRSCESCEEQLVSICESTKVCQ